MEESTGAGVQAVAADGQAGNKQQEQKKNKPSFSFPAFRGAALTSASIFIHVGIYFVVGILGFKHGEAEEQWTYTDGLYFTMMTVSNLYLFSTPMLGLLVVIQPNRTGVFVLSMTILFVPAVSLQMSTVGYGDISPSNTGMRVFTLFMIFWGIIFIFPSIAAAIAPISGPLQDKLQDKLEQKFPAKKVDIDGDGDADYSVPRAPAIFYFKQLFPSLFINVSLQLIFAAIFVLIEENWDYFDAVYHCLVTGTTVGYGDQTIETQAGRLWASAHMAVSVCLLGEMISRVDDARAKRKAELARVEQLRRRLDDHLLEKLQERAKELRPQIEHTGGLSELEFTLCMLLELEMVDLSQVRPFIKQFRQLDVTGCGSLDAEDLALTKRFSADQLASMRGKVGPAHTLPGKGPGGAGGRAAGSAVAPAPEPQAKRDEDPMPSRQS